MSIALPVDASQRAAALDTTRSFCVTAPAGSGKTELLSQRVLALLARVEQPEEVLAITFTRKAAAEMRERILNALRAAQQPEPSEPHKRETWKLAHAALMHAEKRNWNLLQNPQRLRVQTIDGFCSSLTGQMPVLSQFGAQPRITERAAPLYREAIDALLDCLEKDDPVADDLAALMLHVDNRVERLHELLASLLACRDQWLPHIGGGISAETARQHLEATLRTVRTDALSDLQQRMFVYQGDLLPLLDFATQRLGETQPDHPLLQFSGCIELPGADSDDVPRWQLLAAWLLTEKGTWRQRLTVKEGFPAAEGMHKALYKERKAAMTELLAAFEHDDGLREQLAEIRILPAASYPDAHWQMLVQLTRVLTRAVAQLQLVFQLRGEVDFTEISLCALRALGSALNPSELMLRLDNRIRHLLIDEFQDTSSTQYRLLERLVEGWREHNETGAAPQTLFIVGDGMQSIYGFREAKVGLFLEARALGVNQLPLSDAPLCVNFRSTPTIVDWVNRVFKQAFPQHEHIARGAVSYEPSTAFNAEQPHSEVAIYGVRNDPERMAEAEQCVRLVQQALSEDAEGTVAILVRSRSHLRAIVPALRRAHIAFRATDIDPLAQRAHVQDLLTLLRVLLDGVDPISLLALLRSPLVGLDNRSLHTLLTGADNKKLRGVLACLRDPAARSALEEAARLRVEFVVAVLDRAWAERGRKPLRSWLEGVWLALGGDLLIAGEGEWNDVQVLLELIEQSSADIDFAQLEQQLQNLYARADQAVDTRVLLMTIHKSKGLEFDTVIVPALDAGSRSDDKPLLRWSEYLAEDGKLGLVLSVKSALGAEQDATYDWLEYEHKQKQALEDTRLLYVAATRAVKHLYLLFRTQNEQEFKSPAANSLLRKIWSAVEHDVVWIDGVANIAIEANTAQSLQRVPLAWQSARLTVTPSNDEANPPQPIVSSLEISIGNAVHQLLEGLARHGVQSWRGFSAVQKSSKVEQLLRQHGVASVDLPHAAAAVLQAVEAMLADARGAWLLRTDLQEAVCEWELLTAQGKRFVVDRSFIDDGTRWIVDYKSSLPHVGESIAQFAQRELNAYRAQLQTYRDVVRAFESRPIRTALYFPRAAHWLEFIE